MTITELLQNDRFACLDFETANPNRDSVCSVGLVIIENNTIVSKYYSLINPLTTYFNKYCVETHGITYKDVVKSPTFDEIWREVDTIINGSIIVAHNVGFEKSCINACADKFGTNDQYDYLCTLKLARKYLTDMKHHKLNLVCEKLGFTLNNHHNAMSDAEACGKVLIKFKEKYK